MNKLSDQIKIRDEMISNAKKKLQSEGHLDIEDPRIIQIDDLVNANSILPPINNSTIGKASGALIKQLLEGLNGDPKHKAS